MPPDREQALRLLGLDAAVAPSAVEEALLERIPRLEARIAAAPTDAVKDKYRRQLAELEAARQTLLVGAPSPAGLSQTKMADLPLARKAYTRGREASTSAGTGIAIEPGAVVAGRYEVIEQIGVGGMGVVFSVRDRNRDKDIAIKVLVPQLLSSPRARERFLAEARLSSELSHPNIVTVFDVQQEGPYFFLTMELLQGESLRQRLDELARTRQRMPVAEALKIATALCQGLAYAHARTVHCDIKPQNVWLGRDGTVKVMDFGIARVLEDRPAADATTGAVVGTAYYMAPEQLQGHGRIDGRADQYGVAATLYEMLSGHLPTGRIEPLRKARADVPVSLSRAVDKALAVRPADRFADMRAFGAALRPGAVNTVKAHGKGLWIAAAGVVAVAVLAAAVPLARSLLPDHQAAARLRADAARLQGEARSLMRSVEAQRQELRESAGNAGRNVERLEAQQRSAKTPEERLRSWPELLAARQAASSSEAVERGFRGLLDGPEGLPFVEGRLSVAESALKAGDFTEAGGMFQQAVLELSKLRGAVDGLRAALARARTGTVGGLQGRWTVRDCAAASTWAVDVDTLRVVWPGNEPVEARVVFVNGETVHAVVSLPKAQRDHYYRYVRREQRLEVEDITEDRRASLVACN